MFRQYLKEVEQIVEAIPLNKAMQFRRAWDKNRYQDMFMKFSPEMRDRNGFRLYLPYEEDRPPPRVPYDLTQYLANKDYVVTDYVAGLATHTNGKRVMKIGRLITDNPELLKKFSNDPQRSLSRTKGKLVCISRHPYDVAGSSTDRGWTSCMELTNGINKHYVMRDVVEGTIIAYLIHADDKNIQNPISRLLIKPFVNDDDDILLATDKNQYGTHDEKFAKIVEEWLDEVNGPDKQGLYCLNPRLYNDGKSSKFAGRIPVNASPEEQQKFVAQFLKSISAEPQMLKIDDDEYILEYILDEWRDIGRFCSDVYDETLEYLIDLYENNKDVVVNNLDSEKIIKVLRSLPDNLLRNLCRRFDVRFVPESSKMIAELANQREIADEMLDSIKDNRLEILRDRINRYIELGWSFVISIVYLHVPKNGEDYDLDGRVQLRCNRSSMMGVIEDYLNDPDGDDYNDLSNLIRNDLSWSSLDDYPVSEWRGKDSNDELVDKQGNDKVFGSRQQHPKMKFHDIDEPEALADAYASYLRGENSTHIESDQQPDLFESSMRKFINMM